MDIGRVGVVSKRNSSCANGLPPSSVHCSSTAVGELREVQYRFKTGTFHSYFQYFRPKFQVDHQKWLSQTCLTMRSSLCSNSFFLSHVLHFAVCILWCIKVMVYVSFIKHRFLPSCSVWRWFIACSKAASVQKGGPISQPMGRTQAFWLPAIYSCSGKAMTVASPSVAGILALSTEMALSLYI